MRANLFQSSGLWWYVIRIEGEKKRGCRGCRGCRDCQKTAALSFYGLIPENSRTLFSLYSFLLTEGPVQAVFTSRRIIFVSLLTRSVASDSFLFSHAVFSQLGETANWVTDA